MCGFKILYIKERRRILNMRIRNNTLLQEAYEAGYYRALNEQLGQLGQAWYPPKNTPRPPAARVPSGWTLPTAASPEGRLLTYSYKQAEAYYGSDVWNKLTAREQDNLARHFRENYVKPLY